MSGGTEADGGKRELSAATCGKPEDPAAADGKRARPGERANLKGKAAPAGRTNPAASERFPKASAGRQERNGPFVGGAIDAQTRCKHYRGPTDVIAIKFKCCDTYYGCYYCHEEAAGHPPERWGPDERRERAVLCGGCGAELTIEAYLGCGYACPECGIAFNPKCEAHYPLYFSVGN